MRRVLLGLAAHGLPTVGGRLPDRPLAPQEWKPVRAGVRQERLTGQASFAATSGAWAVTDAQRAELEEDHVAALAQVLRLERALLDVHDVLSAADVPFAVLKGTAVAHLDYPDPQARAFGDNDILLPSARFDQGIAALLEHAHVRPAAELGPGFDARFGTGATLVGPGRFELDVHRTLVLGPYGLLIRLEDLWDRLVPFDLGGRELLALGAEQRYLHACFHAVVGNSRRRLLPYRDVAEMLLFGRYDPLRLRGLAAHWSAEVVLARAITETWDALDITESGPLVDWARGHRATRRDRRLMRVYGPGTSYAAKAVAGLTVLRSWRDRLDYVRLLARPAATGPGDGAGRSRVGRLVRGARRVARDARRARPRGP